LSRLDHEIRRVENGSQEKLSGRYPAELSMIKDIRFPDILSAGRFR
jgi:two-component system sensor histidine kinase PhoQ